jgi:hypothetical protein
MNTDFKDVVVGGRSLEQAKEEVEVMRKAIQLFKEYYWIGYLKFDDLKDGLAVSTILEMVILNMINNIQQKQGKD